MQNGQQYITPIYVYDQQWLQPYRVGSIESSLPAMKMSSSKISITCFDSSYDDQKYFPRQACVIY